MIHTMIFDGLKILEDVDREVGQAVKFGNCIYVASEDYLRLRNDPKHAVNIMVEDLYWMIY